MSKRAAHFLRQASLIGTPPTDALVCAYREIGLEVDLYAPDQGIGIEGLGRFRNGVSMRPFAYGKRWFLQNAVCVIRQEYAVFSANSEDPVGVAAPIAKIARRPLIVSADEIFSGAYRGNASERWKRLCRWGMRSASVTIVNDPSRISLQSEYADMSPNAPILVYPGCFRDPPSPTDRAALRKEWGIPIDAFVLVASGHLNTLSCCDWLVRAMRKLPADVHLLLQPLQMDPLSLALLQEMRESHRIHVAPRQLTCRESWSSMSCADAGFVAYRHSGPQFQNMGVSSTRLCMYLQSGLPVIALRQKSFEFVEEKSCGILIDSEGEIARAVDIIRRRYESMSVRAREAIDSVGQMASRYREVVEAVRAVV